MADELVRTWDSLGIYGRRYMVSSMGLSMTFGEIDGRLFEELGFQQQLMLIYTAKAMGKI